MTEMTDGIVADYDGSAATGTANGSPAAQVAIAVEEAALRDVPLVAVRALPVNVGLYRPGGAGAVTALPGGGHGKRMSG
jgi:hypothetical protein